VASVDQKTVVLGAEHDDHLRATLREVLTTLATSKPRHGWIPDFETLDVDIDGHAIHVEAETYIGISISGPADLVDRISEMVKQRSNDS
jgi:hypothetical protein